MEKIFIDYYYSLHFLFSLSFLVLSLSLWVMFSVIFFFDMSLIKFLCCISERMDLVRVLLKE